LKPRVILHVATSIDGRTTGFEPDIGQFYGLVTTWQENLTLAGSDTVMAAPPGPDDSGDAPVKPTEPGRKPLVAVVDSRGRVRQWNALRGFWYWRGVLALCSRSTPARHRAYLARRGVESLTVGERRVDLRRALLTLARRFGARVVRVESGGALNGALLSAGLVDEISLVVHPVQVGGSGPVWHGGAKTKTRFVLKSVRRLKHGLVWLRYRVER